MSSCAANPNFNSGALRSQLNGSAPDITDEAIAKALALKPQLPKPFRLAVYFRAPVTREPHANPGWYWTEDDKKKILALAEPLKAANDIV